MAPDPQHPAIGFSAAAKLDQINQFVAQNENVLGPLESMGNDGNQSVFQFDMTKPVPAANTVIAVNLPAGATQTASGKIFVEGQLTDAVAYHP